MDFLICKLRTSLYGTLILYMYKYALYLCIRVKDSRLYQRFLDSYRTTAAALSLSTVKHFFGKYVKRTSATFFFILRTISGKKRNNFLKSRNREYRQPALELVASFAMEAGKRVSSGSTAAAALEALEKARAEKESKGVISGEDITSLNKFLQWSTANTTKTEQPVSGPNKAVEKTPKQLAADREWLDAAFPDMFGDVKRLVSLLTDENNPLSAEEKVEALEALEETFVDLNYAVNIDKLGALQPILECATAEEPEVRAAAVWALGSALQDLQEVKDVVMQRDGHETLAKCLLDSNAKVRAKAVMASSALLRNSTGEIRERFAEVGGTASLRRLLADDNVLVRRRARFFMQHAKATGNETFVRDLLDDRNSIGAFSDSISALDVEDVADVEAAVGALQVLVEIDKSDLLRVAPELPGVIDQLISRCADADLAESLSSLADSMG